MEVGSQIKILDYLCIEAFVNISSATFSKSIKRACANGFEIS